MVDKIKGGIKGVKTTDCIAVLTLFFSSVLFFCDILLGRFLFTERDLAPYFIPPRFFWVESIKRGDFPLWNPYQFSGHPFFANPQHGLSYPLNGLFFLLPFDVAFNVIIILHFFLGGLFVYLCVRDLGVKPSGALLSGLIFMLSGFLLSVHSLLSCLLSVIWTPLILLFFGRAMANKGLKNEVLTALFMAISFLGGGIEIVYGNFWALLLMVFFYPRSDLPLPQDRLQRFKSIGNTYLIRFKGLFRVSVLFFFLSAIQLIPFLELYFHSIRGHGLSYQEATIWSFSPKDILLFFLPDAYGYFLDMKKYWVAQCWFKTLYMGGLPFLLSLIFFISGKGRKVFLILMLFSIFLALGRYNPFYPLFFKYIPFFNGIRYPAKFLYLFILVLSVTAGLGFHRLIELSGALKRRGLRNLPVFLSLISGLFLLFLILGHQEILHFLKGIEIDFPDFNLLAVNFSNAKRFIFYLALFFLFIRIGIENEWKGWVKGLLLLFLVADLFGNMGFYGKEKTTDYFQKTRGLEKITATPGFFRVFSTPKTTSIDTTILIENASPLEILKEKHLPSMNLLHGVHDIWGIDVIRPKRGNDLYKALTETPSISATNLADLYGVRYVVSVTAIENDPRFELIYSRTEGLQGKEEDLVKENTVKLYRCRNDDHRGWVVRDFRVMDPTAILPRLTSRDFDPRTIVFLEEKPPFPGLANIPAHNRSVSSKGIPSQRHNFHEDRAEILSESNNRLRLAVNAKEDSLLVVNDTYFPGWRAYVDGHEEKIYRADYAFRALPIRSGDHDVLFVYDPLSFKLGAAMTFLGMMACIWTLKKRIP